jgi:hypothetical protein
LEPKGKKQHVTAENDKVKILLTCTLYKHHQDGQIKQDWMKLAQRMHGRDEGCIHKFS